MVDKDLGGELIYRLFESRTDAHLLHLKTRSYSQHKALEEYYESIVGLADELAENMQGRVGILAYAEPAEEESEDSVDENDPSGMLLNLLAWIKDNRAQITDQSDIQNQIDEVVALISRTYYRIEMLR